MTVINLITFVGTIVLNAVLWHTLQEDSTAYDRSLVTLHTLLVIVVVAAPIYLKVVAKTSDFPWRHKWVVRPLTVLILFSAFVLSTAGAFGIAILALACAFYFVGIMINNLMEKKRRTKKKPQGQDLPINYKAP